MRNCGAEKTGVSERETCSQPRFASCPALPEFRQVTETHIFVGVPVPKLMKSRCFGTSFGTGKPQPA